MVPIQCTSYVVGGISIDTICLQLMMASTGALLARYLSSLAHWQLPARRTPPVCQAAEVLLDSLELLMGMSPATCSYLALPASEALEQELPVMGRAVCARCSW
jgi:hypothetical protein